MHCIDLQHCMACSAVAIGVQSNAYPMSASVSTAEKIDLANTILNRLEVFDDCVKPTDLVASKSMVGGNTHTCSLQKSASGKSARTRASLCHSEIATACSSSTGGRDRDMSRHCSCRNRR